MAKDECTMYFYKKFYIVPKIDLWSISYRPSMLFLRIPNRKLIAMQMHKKFKQNLLGVNPFALRTFVPYFGLLYPRVMFQYNTPVKPLILF